MPFADASHLSSGEQFLDKWSSLPFSGNTHSVGIAMSGANRINHHKEQHHMPRKITPLPEWIPQACELMVKYDLSLRQEERAEPPNRPLRK
jgi:hypothetical protein